jgi:hypothetical protein
LEKSRWEEKDKTNNSPDDILLTEGPEEKKSWKRMIIMSTVRTNTLHSEDSMLFL